MARQANVVVKQGQMTPNGRERIMELRAGAKGRGKLIRRVSYWPWSSKSCEAADEYIFAAARREGYEVPSAEDWVE